MGFLDNLKARVNQLRAGFDTELKKYKNKATLTALMAGCAYVAAADGSVSADEKRKMATLVRGSSVTSVFDADEAMAIFNDFAGRFQIDFENGKSEALLAISKLKADSGAARLVIRGCIAIGAADGNFDADEQAVVRTICLELGQNPADFDLDAPGGGRLAKG